MSDQTASARNGSARIQLTPAPSELMSVDQLDTVCLYTYSIAIPVCIFGLISNITNIIVYYKMGLSSVSNICFFCLAITDFNCVSYILVVSFVHHPRLEQPFLPISLNDVALISDTVYFGFSAMGSWITAIINVERSCCVVFPMKVRSMSNIRLFSKIEVVKNRQVSVQGELAERLCIYNSSEGGGRKNAPVLILLHHF